MGSSLPKESLIIGSETGRDEKIPKVPITVFHNVKSKCELKYLTPFKLMKQVGETEYQNLYLEVVDEYCKRVEEDLLSKIIR